MKTMIGLEAHRFASRRLVRALGALVVLGFLVAGPTAFVKSNRDIEKATAAARADAIRGYEDCQRETGGQPGACGELNFEEAAADPRLHLTNLIEISQGVSALLIVLALAAGASFVGADWHNRVITTTLTWEPRRTRVVVAKAVAAATVTFAGAMALLALLAVVLTPAAIWRGTTAGADAAWAGDLAGTILRGAFAAGLAAAIGTAIAMIGRATAFALGVLFAWTAVAENAIRGGIPGWRRWLVADNVGAFVSGGSPEFVRSWPTAGLLIACYAALAVAAAVRFFSRRDVA